MVKNVSGSSASDWEMRCTKKHLLLLLLNLQSLSCNHGAHTATTLAVNAFRLKGGHMWNLVLVTNLSAPCSESSFTLHKLSARPSSITLVSAL